MKKKIFIIISIVIIISLIVLTNQYKEFSLDLIDNTTNTNKNNIEIKPIVYHALFKTIILISPINSNALTLPDTLIISPGVYKFGRNNYELKNEGLYRFILPGIENQQRIVFNNNTMSLMSSVA
jgi:hypothetical protein